MKKTTVISIFDQTKEGALYFDHVIPLHLGYSDDSVELSDIRKEILPPSMQGKSKKEGEKESDALLKINKKWAVLEIHQFYLDLVIKNKEYFYTDYSLRKIDEYKKVGYEFVDSAFDFIKDNNLIKVPILLPSLSSPLKYENKINDTDDFLLTLANLPLINTDNSSWRKIIEFRKDSESIKKVRKLKNLFLKDYEGKSKNFIEDDMLLKLDEYSDTVKDWEFETRVSNISMLASSKSLATTIAGTLGAVFLNEPVAAVIAASGGASIELGKISLNLAKRNYGLHKLRRDHPLSYIISAKKELES